MARLCTELKPLSSKGGFTLLELLMVGALISVLAVMLLAGGWKVYEESSLAISANNLRQLSVGGINYLAENNQIFWKYRDKAPAGQTGSTWWFGFETAASLTAAEGQRTFDPNLGPLAGYVPSAVKPDPSFAMGGNAFKPKYQFGYLGIGYNVLLGGGWLGLTNSIKQTSLPRPGRVVVFATSAQVNNFQAPASAQNPMIEEFYGLDNTQKTVHFRHHGYAMVTYADGSAGFLPMEPSTLDQKLPKANVGLFAPVGSTEYLK